VDAVDRLVVTGAGGVEWIELDGARWEVDVVAIATGRQLDAQLAWMLGCEAAPSFRSPFGTPDRDGEGQTSVAGVLVAGSVAGASTIEEALLDGLAVAGGRSADLAAVLPLSRLGAED
jgi:heterodisulfide reductase subunit A-like polyferredoxin